jgi:4-hydroxy-4-methyl-2-oxoglutarate aldolase
MKSVVVRNIKRAEADVVKRLGALGTSTVHEAYGRSGLMKPYLRPVWAGGEAAGTAVTVLAQPGDNWMIHVGVEQCKPGDILVVGCTTDNTDGMFGDLLATSLKARGVVGLIIDAGCRDVKSLREMGFPVWSKAISAKGTVKATPGAVNVPVVCAGVNVQPGDVVVADDDGVVVVRRKDAGEVATKGEKRQADEEGKRQILASGVLGLDMYKMREPLAKAGLRRLFADQQRLQADGPRGGLRRLRDGDRHVSDGQKLRQADGPAAERGAGAVSACLRALQCQVRNDDACRSERQTRRHPFLHHDNGRVAARHARQ